MEHKVDDEQLLSRVAGGSEPAFAELYDKHAQLILRYALGLMGNHADAADVTQTTFLAAWKKRRTLRVVGGSAAPWLLAACRYAALTALRSRARHPAVSIEAFTIDPPADVDPELAEQVAWVKDAIAAMSDPDRRICQLVLYDGLTYEEAAAELGLSRNVVAKRLERTRNRLRAMRATSEEELS